MWISIQKETESGFPCALWTDSKHTIRFYKEKFEGAWNDYHVTTICTKRDLQRENKQKLSAHYSIIANNSFDATEVELAKMTHASDLRTYQTEKLK